MWQIKTFKTQQAMDKFIRTHKIAYQQIYLNNIPYAIEYKPLKEVKIWY